MMKNTNIKNPDEEQDQSFSFSNQQFVSDSEEGDDGAYIEISLDSIPGRDKDHAFLFRLSFSNMLPRNSDSDESFRDKFLMHDVSVKSTGSQTYTCSFDSSSMSSCSSSSSSVLGRSNARRNRSGMVSETPALAKSSEIRPAEQGNKWRKAVQLLAAQRFVNLLMLSLKSSPEHTGHYDPMTTSELPDENCWKVDKRKRTKVREAISSGLMKLIIKFRAIKTKSKMSLTNLISGPEHITYGHSTERLSYSCYESPVKPFTGKDGKRNNGRRLNEVSINSIKGVIDSVTVSCPGSINSWPIHRNYCTTEIKTYTRENSIQAAIAHCKMSWN
ncbi:unnamed protein product [Rhodiola kirilowii]